MKKSREQIYDELLVIKCQQSDKEAFSELVSRWQNRLFNYAYKVTGSEPAAWDIVQETWFAIIKGIKKLNDASVFPRWAFRIVNNKCTDWLRKSKTRDKLSARFELKNQESTEQKFNSDTKAESLTTAVAKLTPDRRALLELRYHEGFDIAQIARILDVPEGTVKSRLHRTLEQLKQIVEQNRNE